jgi:hypothetical protein
MLQPLLSLKMCILKLYKLHWYLHSLITHTVLLYKKALSTIQRMLHVHKLYYDQTNIKGTVQHCQKFQYSIQYLIQQIANQ